MSEEACYVFKVRSKLNGNKEAAEIEQPSRSIDEKTRLFDSLWGPVQTRINGVINNSNAEVLSDVRNFVFTATSSQNQGKIPAGLLITSASSSIHLFEQLRAQVSSEKNCLYVSITSSDSTNLRNLLKYVISKCTQQDADAPEDEPMGSGQLRPKLLAYDFEILHHFCVNQQIRKIIITVYNSESFETSVLADFITYLKIWIDRIPIVLLFDIATSVSTLQDRLPVAAVRCLHGQSFDAAKTNEVIENVFEAAVCDAPLCFGPALSAFIFQRAKDYTQNIESFVQSLKYAYMCHVYGNSCAVFLDGTASISTANEELFETARHLPSFRLFVHPHLDASPLRSNKHVLRSYVEALLDRKEAAKARDLLRSNDALFQAVQQGIQEARSKQAWLIGAMQIFRSIRGYLPTRNAPPFSKVYLQAMSETPSASPLLQETLTAVRMITYENILLLLPIIYDKLMSMPASNTDISPDDFEDIRAELEPLLAFDHSSRPRNSKGPDLLPRQLAELDLGLLDVKARFVNLLHRYFASCFVPMKDIFLHEIVFCDSKSLLQGALAPRPRFALERALSKPHDYLGCDCCNSSQGPTSSQPSTALLYQLVVESGALINVFDLWTAFSEIMYQQHDDEQMVMSLFFRSLAELKYMGMLKPSRKRVDHIGKVLWQGL